MSIILFFVGLFFGLFAWAQIIYPIFLALPWLIRMKRKGRIKQIPLSKVIFPPVIWIVLSGIIAAFISSSLPASYMGFLLGFWASFVLILTQIRNPDNKKDFESTYLGVHHEPVRYGGTKCSQCDELATVEWMHRVEGRLTPEYRCDLHPMK